MVVPSTTASVSCLHGLSAVHMGGGGGTASEEHNLSHTPKVMFSTKYVVVRQLYFDVVNCVGHQTGYPLPLQGPQNWGLGGSSVAA